ncbi:RagB/SusD family nutrient uptake outer membrane protein [Lacibacter sp. H407]|uniref:RagB/SusD family nutrient uptake outer membrane protein n=1 Tax=Lacibacter sp. H407 TaxID=3133423 RepID=UPI0030BDEA17
MKTNMKSYVAGVAVAFALFASSCTKLEPELGGNESVAPPKQDGAPTPPTISSVYGSLNQLISQENWYALNEHTTDELLGPTRGTDWDDFGTWRRLHLHTWAGDHNQINNVWNGLNGALFQTTLAAELLTGQAQAEGKFLRSYFRFLMIDAFGQMQTRPATAPASSIPNVVPRAQAIDTIILELESAVAGLPAYTGTNRHLATKEAAWTLLAKLYLNKAVYKANPETPAGPYTFAAADMNKVIEYCNNVAANPLLQIETNYWDNFVWTNNSTSSENIFVRRNSDGINVVWATAMGGHYNQTPSGWNGFTTLSDFYDSFEDADVRKSTTLPGFTDQVGTKAGFNVGQVRGPQGQRIGNPLVDLKDRSNNPLVFTRNVSIFFNGEASGIRTNKFPLNPATINDGGFGSTNDFVFLRLSDVRLMKAEAVLRGGTSPETPLAIVNDIRTKRNASVLASVTLNTLIAERGRELYLEGWRRNDMIRFGIFNSPVQERPNASEAFKVVFPLPNIALSSNPNLKQNFGY